GTGGEGDDQNDRQGASHGGGSWVRDVRRPRGSSRRRHRPMTFLVNAATASATPAIAAGRVAAMDLGCANEWSPPSTTCIAPESLSRLRSAFSSSGVPN